VGVSWTEGLAGEQIVWCGLWEEGPYCSAETRVSEKTRERRESESIGERERDGGRDSVRGMERLRD